MEIRVTISVFNKNWGEVVGKSELKIFFTESIQGI